MNTRSKPVAPEKKLTTQFLLKADTGASRHFVKSEHLEHLGSIQRIKNGPSALLPNNEKIKPTFVGNLPINTRLKEDATEALVYPDITNESLLSIGQLCDDGCIAIFTRTKLYIIKNGEVVLVGQRNQRDKLWDVQLNKETEHENLHYIVLKDQSKRDLAEFLHACAFSPAISTLQVAVNKGNFITWPGIEGLNFKRLIGTTIATAKGHLDQERANLRSTKIITENNTDNDHFPEKEANKTFECYAIAIATPETSTTYSDQTGRFPYKSSRGNSYIFLLYVYDANGILVKAIKDRKGATLTEAWKDCNARLQQHGHKTKLHVMDNEVSEGFTAALQENGIEYQLAPPGNHRTNPAERAIRTYKNHYLAGLATCDPKYPVREWDRIIPQSELTINLLRNSRINPNLSSWAINIRLTAFSLNTKSEHRY